jgi:hypothetical protein
MMALSGRIFLLCLCADYYDRSDMNLKIPKKTTFKSFLKVFNKEESSHRGEVSSGVYRGTGYVMSSFLEDLFAVYLKKELGETAYAILVDVSMTIGKTHCRPDIAIVEQNEDSRALIGFLDCKTSLGWNRNGVRSMAEKYCSLRQEIIGNDCKVRIGGIGQEADGTCLDGDYSVRENFAWDVFIKDVWGKGSELSVMEQINAWNEEADTSLYTKILWGHYLPPSKASAEYQINEDIFAQIAKRIFDRSSITM